jgi:uncharacterized protein
MALKIEETFQVEAPIARVWNYLVDPHQLVQCLPGAELVEVQDGTTFLGRVRVKVGPITASYKGKAIFVELDEESRQVRMVAEGQETGGSGSAKMTMLSTLVELRDGGTEVRVHAEIDVVGRIVQFGRGMIEEVNRQLFREFASCTQARLTRPTEGVSEAVSGTMESRPRVSSAGDGETVGPSAEAALAATESGQPPLHTPAQSRDAVSARASQPPPPPTQSQPLEVVALLLRGLWAMIRRFFGRLMGRGG